jgi:two-component system, NarL family, sensor histidine kinase UhpB
LNFPENITVTTKTLRLLLVEDNPGEAWLMRKALADAPEPGWRLEVGGTVAEGVEALHRYEFDVVLLDLHLPDGDGLETLAKIRAHAPDLPIVILSGSDDHNLALEAVQAGAQDYLVKGDTDSKVVLRAVLYAIERHRIEKALRRSEEAYRSLIDDVFNDSLVSIFILDKDFRVVWVNRATEIYFGVRREDVLYQDKRMLIHEQIKHIFEEPEEYAAGLLGTYQQGDYSHKLECHVMPSEGRDERWLEHWSQPIRSGIFAGGRIEHYADITQRKISEKALQDLATLEERQRLARELHDSVTQSIFSIKMMTESALRQWEGNPSKAHTLMEQVQKVTVSALQELRILLLELRPQSMTQVGFRQLIELLADSIRSRKPIEIEMEIDDLPQLPAEIQTALYRILQESLNNAIKHAEATLIHVSVRHLRDRLEMEIQDNGRGFDLNKVAGTSLGLGIMKERADTAGLSLEISSAPGKGTQLCVVWHY